MTKKIAIAIALFTGLWLIFIGARFLTYPETAESGYGINFNENADYSFHYIKGIRDLFSGLIIFLFVVTRQTKALGLTLLAGTIIPVTDFFIVLSKPANGVTAAIPHMSAILVCFIVGVILLQTRKKQKGNYNGFATILQSADSNNESIIEYNIVPTEKTPWHYHTAFSETFEILHGELEVGLNNHVHHLVKGNHVTVQPNEKHYFHNVSGEECLIKVTIRPGNKPFENSLRILKGLAKDGLASASGVPGKFTDLALFVYLNNSRMVGFQKLAEPLFRSLAKRAIKQGRLKELEKRYC